MNTTEVARRCAEAMLAKDAASRALGIRIDIPEAGEAVAYMTVRGDMVNGFDVCHGGLLFTLADTAFAFACNAYDNLTFAAAANIEFIRPALLGDELRALAREDYRGSKRGLYTVELRNQREEVVALFHGRSASRGERLL
ncbi:MAG: hydroxyphenylacetyl-CoA thioesterase PaaI [Gammaproteobacteria bacterium]|jgi:acyl-CoA thioesterase|nr:hydroxyphenylacetyl-CoA thioesterase PaaI [Gammaproteobacteria bacterium]MDH3758102.1 hydroxyphenylacetyl-CoA thioesterase PaaI [Gammaproteobacteria bacterium]MDH3846837.1 hydroxyphenylacetyl-CoA thioesterase PaaI [Gammaproteobacteria bacterium]MDH3863005.1 hydroxyphenylacetyl-CoA thioesterase PaaI [Gammaproteobacteria bacterium]MDH3906857.1 hydroxyphenylacetyl-CoA thioesterase PaaI [Gammaproteobacteria bacterium]